MRVCLLTDRPRHPVFSAVVRQLRHRHEVHVLDTAGAALEVRGLQAERRQAADVYLLRSHTPDAIFVAHELERVGAHVVNSANATAICAERDQIAARLSNAGLPWPHTWSLLGLSQPRAVPPAFPIVVKSRRSRRGDVVQIVHSIEQLAKLAAQHPDEPFVLQEYLPNDGVDRKLYVVDERVLGISCASGLSRDSSARVPMAVRDGWARLAYEVGRLLGLSVFGVDLVLTEGGPAIVDVNAFPGFRGVPRAASLLVAMVERMGAPMEATV